MTAANGGPIDLMQNQHLLQFVQYVASVCAVNYSKLQYTAKCKQSITAVNVVSKDFISEMCHCN